MNRLSNLLLQYRRPLVVLAHCVLWVGAYVGAFLLRFDFTIPEAWRSWSYALWVLPLIVARLGAFAWYGLFQGMWKYTGQRDLEDLLKATLLSTGVFALAVLAIGPNPFPRSVFLAEPMLAIGLAAGLRLSVRAVATTARRIEIPEKQDLRRLLIVGAGDAGEMLLREVNRNMPGVVPVGFLDDAPLKWGMTVHGVRVVGRIEEASRLIEELGVTEVVIAIPTATGKEMRRIIDSVSRHGVSVRTLPDMEHLIDGRVTFNQIREVAIEDLLGRDPVQLDQQRISDMIRNDVVLVTGAGGSIGSELCRQIARFHPRRLVLMEQAENALYHIHRELEARYPNVEFVPRIADVTDRARLDQVFSETHPGFVLHAAAHKHVPMMEWNPGEAVKNNVGGTRAVADAAHRHNVARFVMISTDKAVNPTSVMGCTKRVAELYVQSMAEHSRTVFTTVRFGNVLGSNGSVIPLFKEQIARGGPVTVTHPDMVRYFMTIPEASQLVLQAAAMGKSGEIYVLDMGEPVRIVQLAEDLIRLSGLQPNRDVEIQFTGVRPGEKLFEELSTTDEDVNRTQHEKIFVGKSPPMPHVQIAAAVEELLEDQTSTTVRRGLKGIVPEFVGREETPSPANVIPLRG
ncbi:MAG: polysaccharide biosynthesis protein [Alphaproteobacteria bacterium]|nr:polysaccharide biosynthesis protein [Alphaproteobacteria bacterium]MCB9697328.1 polysaccharide biosynthesis protein [Alphaproteobacteria bacterium]